MKNKKILALTLVTVTVVILLAVLVLVLCNASDGTYSLWANAMRDIKRSRSINADIEIEYGGETYIISAQHNTSDSSRILNVKTTQNGNMKIISDGKTDYYDCSGVKYSTAYKYDNPAMKKLLSYTLSSTSSLRLTKETFADAEIEDDGITTIKVVASGKDIKDALSPGEDIEFSENVKLTAKFDGKKLVSLTLDGEIGGKDFFGLPIYESGEIGKKTNFSARITNISYSKSKVKLITKDENTSEYPDMPALAQLNASSWLRNLKLSSKYKYNATLEIPVQKYDRNFTLRYPFACAVTMAEENGYMTTRTLIRSKTFLVGYFVSELVEVDTFTDGKSDYIYYIKENPQDCFKTLYKPKKDDYDLSGVADLFKDQSNLQKYYGNAEISESEENTVVTLTLTGVPLMKLMDMTAEYKNLIYGKASDTLEIKSTINKNGIIDSIIINFSAVLSKDNIASFEYAGTDVKMSMDIEFSDIYTHIVPDIPQGYEDYHER